MDNQPHQETPSAWRVIYPGTSVIVHRDTRQEVETIASRAATTAIAQCYIPGIGWVPTTKIATP